MQKPKTCSGEPDELNQFLGSIPSPERIRERISRNASENSMLKRLLRVSEAAQATKNREASHAS
jgi:hypothetical protein